MSIRDIIEAASEPPWGIKLWEHDSIADITDAEGHYLAQDADPSDADFIATFDPTHVALMEAVVEAAGIRVGGIDADGLEAALDALDAYRVGKGLE